MDRLEKLTKANRRIRNDETRKKRKWTIGCLGGFAALLVVGVGIGVYVLKPYGRPGPFQQSDLESVIALIREEKLEPGRVHRFRLDDKLSPKSLRRLGADERVMRGEGRGFLWAKVELNRTRISDEGLEHLLEHPSLWAIGLKETRVTDDGVERLRPTLSKNSPVMVEARVDQ